jgi:hypothetical protein
MRIMTALLATALSLGDAGTSHAVVRIANDRGGLIQRYLDRYARLNATSQTIVIDGLCASACTMVLAMIPHERMCVTDTAILGFHAAWDLGPRGRRITNPEATRTMYSMYPAPIRNWISERGGLSAHIIYLRGMRLNAMYPPCYLDTTVFLRA